MITAMVSRTTLAPSPTATAELSGTPGYRGFGDRRGRVENERLLRGKGRFTDDQHPRGTCAVAFLRSPLAHGRILKLDVERARQMTGVLDVLIGADVAGLTVPARTGEAPVIMTENMPTSIVRFHGDIVAAVAAVDRYVAEDALELIDVEYEPLPAVASIDDARSMTGVMVVPELESNIYCTEVESFGDVDAAFAGGARTVHRTFRTQRMTHAPIETRAILAEWDDGAGFLTVRTGQQMPHYYRTEIARRLRITENHVRVISPDVGGAFGLKIPVYREEVVCALFAMRLGRPAKWIEDRTENLMASAHSRDEIADVEAAFDETGVIAAMRVRLWCDYGAYSFFGPRYPISAVGWLSPGPYKFENFSYEYNVAMTNKCPVGTLRAPHVLASWITEGMIESIAAEVGVDAVEIRRRNAVHAADQPYRSASGYIYEAITPLETMDDVLRRFDLDEFRRRQQDELRSGRHLGVGLALVLEPTTYGSGWYKAHGGRGSGHETSSITMNPDGTVTVSVGIAPSGQGYETSLAQVVAEVLGCDPALVAVSLGDTAIAPYGMGSKGSRGAAAGHGAAYQAASVLRDKIAAIRSHIASDGDRSPLSDSDIAQLAYHDPGALPPGMEPGLQCQVAYDPPPMTFSNAAHLCVVEVFPDTGVVDLLDYHISEDAGTVINPRIVDGQIRGGTLLGVSQALLEEVVYDEDGVNVTGTLMDYLLPPISLLPRLTISHLETPNPWTVRGMKGMAEGPVQGGLTSCMIAINDALRPAEVSVWSSPASPSRLLAALRDRELTHETYSEANRAR